MGLFVGPFIDAFVSAFVGSFVGVGGRMDDQMGGRVGSVGVGAYFVLFVSLRETPMPTHSPPCTVVVLVL